MVNSIKGFSGVLINAYGKCPIFQAVYMYMFIYENHKCHVRGVQFSKKDIEIFQDSN